MSHDTDPAGSLCKQNASSLVVTGSLGGGEPADEDDTSKSQDPSGHSDTCQTTSSLPAKQKEL